MSIGKLALSISKEPGVGYAILIAAAVAGFYVVHKLLKADVQEGAKAIGSAATATLDTASSLATGNFASAHGTPYEDTGIFGTLGFGLNEVLGGAPQAFGEWIGDKLSPDYDPSEASLQHANNNPYGGGPSSQYADAADSSPTAAQYAANPNTQTPVADFGIIDGTVWN